MPAGRASRHAGERRADRGIDTVPFLREPPRVVVGRDREAFHWSELHTGACVMDVLPANLIGQAVLVVWCRIQVVEGAADAVGRVRIAGGIVVFAGEPHAGGARQRLAQLPVSRPGLNVVAAKRSTL